jgi:hypothetical protein
VILSPIEALGGTTSGAEWTEEEGETDASRSGGCEQEWRR